MKKISVWLVAITTSLVSLIAMLIFDSILSLIYYFIGKVSFLFEIIDFIGEILDLGLTVLVAYLIAIAIWGYGHTIIEKIKGESVKFKDSPISSINNLFCFIFLAMVIFLGIKFATVIGDTVMTYTADLQGFKQILMFFKAIKDTVLFVCSENIIIYKIGANSLVLGVINIFSDKFI